MTFLLPLGIKELIETFRRKLEGLDIFKKTLGDSRIFRRQKQILGYFRNFRRRDNPIWCDCVSHFSPFPELTLFTNSFVSTIISHHVSLSQAGPFIHPWALSTYAPATPHWHSWHWSWNLKTFSWCLLLSHVKVTYQCFILDHK